MRNRETGTRFPNQRALILVIVIEGMPVLFDHQRHHYHHHHHHLSLNREGLLGATNNFTTSFLQFSLFSTALWDLANSRPVPFPGSVFPPLPLSALSSSAFHCALQDGFCQTR